MTVHLGNTSKSPIHFVPFNYQRERDYIYVVYKGPFFSINICLAESHCLIWLFVFVIIFLRQFTISSLLIFVPAFFFEA